MNVEIIMQKLLAIGSFFVAGLISIVGSIKPDALPEGWDEVGTILALSIGVIILYKEWKNSQEYNRKRDKRLEKIIGNNTKVMKDFQREIEAIHDRIDKNRYLINNFERSQNN